MHTNSYKTQLDSGKKAEVVVKCGNKIKSMRNLGLTADLKVKVKPPGKSIMGYLQLTAKFYWAGRVVGGEADEEMPCQQFRW